MKKVTCKSKSEKSNVKKVSVKINVKKVIVPKKSTYRQNKRFCNNGKTPDGNPQIRLIYMRNKNASDLISFSIKWFPNVRIVVQNVVDFLDLQNIDKFLKNRRRNHPSYLYRACQKYGICLHRNFKTNFLGIYTTM